MSRRYVVAAKGTGLDLQHAVENKIIALGGDIESCSAVEGASGSASEMLDAFEEKLDEFDVESATAITASENAAKRFKTFEQFADRMYSQYYVPEEDIDAEIAAVKVEIKKLGGDPEQCPTYWRDDYDEPIIEVDGRYYFETFRGVEARLTPINEDVFGELSSYGINACGAIEDISKPIEGGQPTGRYKLCDTHGAPQAGGDEILFDEWYEVEEYLDEHPDVQERIAEGYANIYDLEDM